MMFLTLVITNIMVTKLTAIKIVRLHLLVLFRKGRAKTKTLASIKGKVKWISVLRKIFIQPLPKWGADTLDEAGLACPI